MDKCESELLEEWDVVSLETEKESEEKEECKAKNNTETNIENTDTNTISNVNAKSESNADAQIESNVKHESSAIVEPESEEDDEPVSEITAESKNDATIHIEINVAEFESDTIAEPASNSTEPEINAAEPENNAATESKTNTTTEPESYITVEHISYDDTEPEDHTETEIKSDCDAYSEKNIDVDVKSETEAIEQITDNINIVDDDDNPINNVIESSLESIEIEHFDGSCVQDSEELVPDIIQVELENAAVESSSSDIDIIDENLEESITSSFLPPLSVSFSSSVADTSSILTSQSEDDREGKPKQKIEDLERKDYIKKEDIKKEFKSTVYSEKSYREDPKETVHQHSHKSQRTTGGRSVYDWFAFLIQFLSNLSGWNWCLIGGIAITLGFTFVTNHVNIFAIVEKDNVVLSQMKNMIDELKHDNKMLKEQMISEMKNEKVLSSFEHQIRELRKDNSKLNHMLYDVAKVLDKQKNSQEKKDAEYLAPFKKEINKLKEHINILKFDNEELQKQLVRMRYASYSQGGTDASKNKDHVKKEDGAQADEDSTEEIPLDIESLKKWNELISLLTKELGALSANAFKEEKSHPEGEKKNIKAIWKSFVNDFKGTFNDFRKINISAIISDYRKANEKAVSDIYKFVKDFFTVEENAKQYPTPDDDGTQWKNIADFVNDLGEKWTNIKDRLYTTDLKNFFTKKFKKTGDETSHGTYHSQKSKGAAFEHSESKTKDGNFESEKKSDEVQTPEETKWMFKRAAHRAELRDTDEESSVNWFLKKGRHTSEDDTEERRH